MTALERAQARQRAGQGFREQSLPPEGAHGPGPGGEQPHQGRTGDDPAQQQGAEAAGRAGGLRRHLGTGPLHGATERHQAGAHRLTGPALEAEPDDVAEAVVDLEDALGHGAHRHQATAGRGSVEPGEPVGGTVGKAQAALDAGAEFCLGGMELRHPPHQIPPGSRPGSRMRAGSNAATTRRWSSRPGGGVPQGSATERPRRRTRVPPLPSAHCRRGRGS